MWNINDENLKMLKNRWDENKIVMMTIENYLSDKCFKFEIFDILLKVGININTISSEIGKIELIETWNQKVTTLRDVVKKWNKLQKYYDEKHGITLTT
jgi:aspartokinase